MSKGKEGDEEEEFISLQIGSVIVHVVVIVARRYSFSRVDASSRTARIIVSRNLSRHGIKIK